MVAKKKSNAKRTRSSKSIVRGLARTQKQRVVPKRDGTTQKRKKKKSNSSSKKFVVSALVMMCLGFGVVSAVQWWNRAPAAAATAASEVQEKGEWMALWDKLVDRIFDRDVPRVSEKKPKKKKAAKKKALKKPTIVTKTSEKKLPDGARAEMAAPPPEDYLKETHSLYDAAPSPQQAKNDARARIDSILRSAGVGD